MFRVRTEYGPEAPKFRLTGLRPFGFESREREVEVKVVYRREPKQTLTKAAGGVRRPALLISSEGV